MNKKCREKYGFQEGECILSSTVWGVCYERIRDGCIKRTETKKALVELMEKHAPAHIVWQPMSDGGFGASPFNPNCWRTTEGKPIFTPEVSALASQILKELRAQHR